MECKCYRWISVFHVNFVFQSLESIKSSIKQESLGDGGNGTAVCSEDEKLELCNKLYRLIFQVVLLFENYVKLMEIFRSVTSSPQVN